MKYPPLPVERPERIITDIAAKLFSISAKLFRVALITYLSLTTVFGPLLCCCNAQQLLSATDGLKICCGKSADLKSEAHSGERAAHAHRHAHADHSHSHSPAGKTPEPTRAPLDNEHDGQDCPCGKHHASLVATVAAEGLQLRAVEWHAQTWFVLVALLPNLPKVDAESASLIAQMRPAVLYGREILRAYQIMRC